MPIYGNPSPGAVSQNRVGLEIFQIWSCYTTTLELEFDADFEKPHD